MSEVSKVLVHEPSSNPSEGASTAAYGLRLAAMADDDFLQEAERQIWLSAYASNNPRAAAHRKADTAYEEAARRGKPWLYQRAWNAAYQSCGYEPSDGDIAAARPPEQTVVAEAREGGSTTAEPPQKAQPQKDPNHV